MDFKSRGKAVAYEKFQGSHKAKRRKVRSPTSEVLGVAAKKVGAQSIFLGDPVRQQPCKEDWGELKIQHGGYNEL